MARYEAWTSLNAQFLQKLIKEKVPRADVYAIAEQYFGASKRNVDAEMKRLGLRWEDEVENEATPEEDVSRQTSEEPTKKTPKAPPKPPKDGGVNNRPKKSGFLAAMGEFAVHSTLAAILPGARPFARGLRHPVRYAERLMLGALLPGARGLYDLGRDYTEKTKPAAAPAGAGIQPQQVDALRIKVGAIEDFTQRTAEGTEALVAGQEKEIQAVTELTEVIKNNKGSSSDGSNSLANDVIGTIAKAKVLKSAGGGIGAAAKAAAATGGRVAGARAAARLAARSGRVIGGAALGGVIEGLLEYWETGDAKRAASVGVGAVAGGSGGAIAGAAIGGLGGPLAPITVPLGAFVGGVVGSMGGAAGGRAIYDYSGSDAALKRIQKHQKAQEQKGSVFDRLTKPPGLYSPMSLRETDETRLAELTLEAREITFEADEVIFKGAGRATGSVGRAAFQSAALTSSGEDATALSAGAMSGTSSALGAVGSAGGASVLTRPGGLLASLDPNGGAGLGGVGGLGGSSAALNAGAQSPGGYNYMHGQHGGPGENLVPVMTAYGKITVNAASAEAFKGFFDDLAANGAPLRHLGSYAYRMKRGGGSGWSQHAYGNAIDMDDQVLLSPAMRRWVEENPERWRAILNRRGIVWGGDFGGRPGAGWDQGHLEYRGVHPALAASEGIYGKEVKKEAKQEKKKTADSKKPDDTEPESGPVPVPAQKPTQELATGGTRRRRRSYTKNDSITIVGERGPEVMRDPGKLTGRVVGLSGPEVISGGGDEYIERSLPSHVTNPSYNDDTSAGATSRGYGRVINPGTLGGIRMEEKPLVDSRGETLHPAYRKVMEQTGASVDEITALRRGVSQIESGSNKNVRGRNPLGDYKLQDRGNANYGRYQFNDEDARDIHTKIFGRTGRAPTRTDFIKDPQLQEEYYAGYLLLKDRELRANKSAGKLYKDADTGKKLEALAVAQLGSGTAARYLKRGDAFTLDKNLPTSEFTGAVRSQLAEAKQLTDTPRESNATRIAEQGRLKYESGKRLAEESADLAMKDTQTAVVTPSIHIIEREQRVTKTVKEKEPVELKSATSDELQNSAMSGALAAMAF